ncbi:hypothetical protein [Actinomadura kijaniata]|uniref:hypothetical protein n=1 Tax=Actinomadura kijaniata TaxID=46161 RepID=UPI000832C2C7|nr:hypothetical protein [Actinomadura kijaniata]
MTVSPLPPRTDQTPTNPTQNTSQDTAQNTAQDTVPDPRQVVTQVVATVERAAHQIERALQELSPCPHLPAWPRGPLRSPAEVMAMVEQVERMHTHLSRRACSCPHDIHALVIQHLARSWLALVSRAQLHTRIAARPSRLAPHTARGLTERAQGIATDTAWIVFGHQGAASPAAAQAA